MAEINNFGIVQRTIMGKRNPNGKSTKRDLFLVIDKIYVGNVSIPKKYIGKHIRFRVEIIK